MMKAFMAVTISVSAAKPAFALGQNEAPTNSSQAGTVTAALAPGLGRNARTVPVPAPLSVQDATLYAHAFQQESAGHWAIAAHDLSEVSDPVLKGHLLAKHYLSNSTRTSVEDLQNWMVENADLPQAEDIYRLAAAKGSRSLKDPMRGSLVGGAVDITDDGSNWEELIFAEEANTALGRTFRAQLRQAFHNHQMELAGRILHDASLKTTNNADLDGIKLLAALNYFVLGMSQEARDLAEDVIARSPTEEPAAYWMAGLSQWRLGQPDKARHHFEHLAEAHDSTSWMMAAGAFWAARANLVSHHPEVVNHWLEIAATYPRTFYGLMARRILGYETLFSWTSVPFTEEDANTLLRVPGGRRALALLQLGQRQAAEEEIRRAYPHAGKSLRQSILALAQNTDMDGLAVRLGGMASGQGNDNVSYPVPQWIPNTGWSLDRALVFAFVRQESRFNPQAHSARGAGGLMQIMPATAIAITGNKQAKNHLTDPAYNLGLGQRYLSKLMNTDPVNGNLIYLAASYNAGPGKVTQWINSFGKNNDPLLFVECLPSRETRTFVQQIMTNYWVYRGRLGQPSNSLDQIATGQWPMYDNGIPAKVRSVSTK